MTLFVLFLCISLPLIEHPLYCISIALLQATNCLDILQHGAGLEKFHRYIIEIENFYQRGNLSYHSTGTYLYLSFFLRGVYFPLPSSLFFLSSVFFVSRPCLTCNLFRFYGSFFFCT